MREDRDCINARRWGCIAVVALYALAIAASVWLCVALVGCTSATYVPVETVRTEYRDRDVERLVTDTVRDTRVVWIKGDTVVDIREKERVNRAEIRDTCYIEHIDTIQVPYPVERRLTMWQQTKIDYGGEAIVTLAVILTAAIVWLIKKFRK